MKKKFLLIISMFLFITNVNALTFNVNLTDIEDKGSNTIGIITNIDVPNKSLNVLFQDIGDEVNFGLTITNSGDRAGTLRSITVTSSNDKIEYTNNLPENGLAINGNDTNEVIIKAKLLPKAVNGISSSEIKIIYNYDEGSCPDDEILSSDESMCLCKEGTERNERGICVDPEEEKCADDEIYNETKKICEKKVVPANPSNPKTLDNIILITLLFIVSGLGIYAAMFKRLKTDKKKIIVGVITGVITLVISLTTLVSVFGADDLLSAIINPITKSKELILTVNEKVELIETWDGECSLEIENLTPSNLFDGGTGTQSDPYQIKTAEQLSCFAKSVNNGNTYEGMYIKQTKNIKLNDHLGDKVAGEDLDSANVWLSAGYRYYDSDLSQNVIASFNGTYDGNNNKISGLYITNGSSLNGSYRGLFGAVKNATLKNIILSDTYINSNGYAAGLSGLALGSLTIDNVSIYGRGDFHAGDGAGLISNLEGENTGFLKLENSINNLVMNCDYSCSGLIHRIEGIPSSEEPNIVFKNDVNKGNISFVNDSPSGAGGLAGYINVNRRRGGSLLIDNCKNEGIFTSIPRSGGSVGGLIGYASTPSITMTNSSNIGTFINFDRSAPVGGLLGNMYTNGTVINNCYNSGDFTSDTFPSGYSNQTSVSYVGGIVGYVSGGLNISNCFNTGNLTGNFAYLSGIVGYSSDSSILENCYNKGKLTGYGYVGGIVGSFAGNITKSYNTGDIHVFGGARSGGIVGWSSGDISNSYNTGDILVTSGSGQHGGICPTSCGRISNSYNRGNITISRYGSDIGGITGQGSTIVNSYNSGTITFLDEARGYSPYIGGISNGGDAVNSYNLGDINVTLNGNNGATFQLAGVSMQGSATNSVNTGDITVKLNMDSFTGSPVMFMAGVSYRGPAVNSYNAGVLTVDDSDMGTPLNQIPNGMKNYGIGEIQFNFSDDATGNKWNNNSNLNALGCLTEVNNPQLSESCTLQNSNLVGSYTTDPVPSILSIINGDNAYNSDLDEEGLPTLKVFNE
jgi:hypothetical protein